MENHTNKTYQERMNKTASTKFGAIKKHLNKGVRMLDFGSGFSPEFINQVKETGAHYVAYDVSQIVQNQLKENNIDFLTKEQLKNTENQFNVIYLSSVFHELMSYLSRPERRETFAMIDKALKPDGVIVIRDWGPGHQLRRPFALEVVSKDVNNEVQTWVEALIKNSIINTPWVVKDENDNVIVPYVYKHSHIIEKWICTPHNYKIVHRYEEYDESYLPHLQKYFKLDSLPWPTKIIYELKKEAC